MTTMLKINERPYVLLLFTAIILFFTRAFAPLAKIEYTDITLFSIPVAKIGWIIPFLLTTIWLIYLLTRRFLYSRIISWIHVLITVTTIILIVVLFFIGINPNQPGSVDRQELIGNVSRIVFIIFVCGQSLYIFNFLLGLFTKDK